MTDLAETKKKETTAMTETTKTTAMTETTKTTNTTEMTETTTISAVTGAKDGLQHPLWVGVSVVWVRSKSITHLATVVRIKKIESKICGVGPDNVEFQVRVQYKFVDGVGNVSLQTTPWVPAKNVIALPVCDNDGNIFV